MPPADLKELDARALDIQAQIFDLIAKVGDEVPPLRAELKAVLMQANASDPAVGSMMFSHRRCAAVQAVPDWSPGGFPLLATMLKEKRQREADARWAKEHADEITAARAQAQADTVARDARAEAQSGASRRQV
jgi:hypothetical protein